MLSLKEVILFSLFTPQFSYNWNITEIKNLDESKATQTNDTLTKVTKENFDIFATFITENVNNMFESSFFPDSLKQPGIKPVYKKILGMKRKTTGQ